MKHTITRLFLALCTLPLGACGEPKGDASGTITGTTANSDGTSGTSEGSATTSATQPTSSAGTSTTGATTATASSSATASTGDTTGNTTGGLTDGTTGTSGGTTGGECQIELPDPGSCFKLTPDDAPPDGFRNRFDDEQEAFGASSSSSSGGGFIQGPDLGDAMECDLFAQDCAAGEKCNAWSSDGDSSWDATKCVPLDPNPDPVGAPCTVEGGGTSGVDSCDKGAMCWGVDAQTGEGTCVEICTCSFDNPICTTPNTTCIISNNNSLVLCLPVCDPLDPGACDGGDVCISNPSGEYFICVIDASGDEGQAGDPCEYLNACDPAHACLEPSLFPGCDPQSIGCCVPFCSVSGMDCPQGSSCTPWYEQGQAPKCFEDVGVCMAM